MAARLPARPIRRFRRAVSAIPNTNRSRRTLPANQGRGRSPALAANQAPAPAANQDPPPSPWRNSRAKTLLQQDILSGRAKTFKGPSALYQSRPEYKRYKKANFINNFYSLRKSLESMNTVAAAGLQAFRNDVGRLAQNRVGFHFNGSALQRQLRRDVVEGLTANKTPSEVRESRALYKDAPITLQQFRNYLWQERRRVERRSQSAQFRERMQFITGQIDTNNPINNNNEEDNNDINVIQEEE